MPPTYVAEELREPKRTLPRALIVGTLAVAVMYLALNVVFIFGVPGEHEGSACRR